ncbi:hypothetical protein [Streptomyces sp. NPDC051286]|uniref:hypothetical protein n=1 Tax=Streptomyces sp. NPDC051286 TaxID=3365647 RepID=UPI00378DE899
MRGAVDARRRSARSADLPAVASLRSLLGFHTERGGDPLERQQRHARAAAGRAGGQQQGTLQGLQVVAGDLEQRERGSDIVGAVLGPSPKIRHCEPQASISPLLHAVHAHQAQRLFASDPRWRKTTGMTEVPEDHRASRPWPGGATPLGLGSRRPRPPPQAAPWWARW